MINESFKMSHGRLFGLGLGPGDPELVTLKTLRLLQAADIIAYPTAKAGSGNALKTAQPHILPGQEMLPLVYPVTAGSQADRADYRPRMKEFYDVTSNQIAEQLVRGRDVAILCAGDPFVYGSFMYWHARLAQRFETLVVPGISSIFAGPVVAGNPWCLRTDVLTVIPGTLGEEDIAARLKGTDAAVIIKLGRTFAKVRRALDGAGVLARAIYVERATMEGEKVQPAANVDANTVPYFSLVFVPGSDVD